MTVTVDIPLEEILRRRGLGPGREAKKYLANQALSRTDRYVPYRTGLLKNTAFLTPDGSAMVYPQPYAAPQFTRAYRHADPLRGDHWHRRMLEIQGRELVSDLAAFVGGEPR